MAAAVVSALPVSVLFLFQRRAGAGLYRRRREGLDGVLGDGVLVEFMAESGALGTCR